MLGVIALFGLLQLLTIWYFISRPVDNPVIIGLPDAERKTMSWMAKPEKTQWDKIKEGLPFFSWGVFAGFVTTLIIMI